MKSSNPDKQSYKGIFRPRNSHKYQSKHPCVYRSSWELQFAKWCDQNPNVEWWKSESTIIPYVSKVDNRWHRYYIDFTVKFKNQGIVLFEIKPTKQTKAPNKQKRITKKYLTEVKTYATNISKWEAAKEYAQKRGYSFQILTEKELRKLGMHII